MWKKHKKTLELLEYLRIAKIELFEDYLDGCYGRVESLEQLALAQSHGLGFTNALIRIQDVIEDIGQAEEEDSKGGIKKQIKYHTINLLLIGLCRLYQRRACCTKKRLLS